LAPAPKPDIEDFDFTGTPVNEALILDLASGAFLVEQRNAVLIGGTGTGKSHLAIAIARACIRGLLSHGWRKNRHAHDLVSLCFGCELKTQLGFGRTFTERQASSRPSDRRH
jgi:IstB-like ATP binding protein